MSVRRQALSTLVAATVVTSIGPAKDNKFRIKLDTRARIGLDAAIHHEMGIWRSGRSSTSR